MTIDYNNFKQVFRAKNFRYSFALFLTLAVITAQTLVLQHDHDGDLTHHVDCSICVKQGGETDALTVVIGMPKVFRHAVIPTPELNFFLSVTPLVTRSRGPPLANS